jgi:hypothetical protein
MHIRKITVCVRDTTWFVELIAGLQQRKCEFEAVLNNDERQWEITLY